MTCLPKRKYDAFPFQENGIKLSNTPLTKAPSKFAKFEMF